MWYTNTEGDNMRLKRKIDKYLIEWKKSKNKMPLIVKGARQIGKTESIKNFGLNNYKSLIEINTGMSATVGNNVNVKYNVDNPNEAYLPDNDSNVTW